MSKTSLCSRGLLVLCATSLIVAACDSGGSRSTTGAGETKFDTTTAGLDVLLDEGAAITTDGIVDVTVAAGFPASEAQIAESPSFANATWTSLAEPLSHEFVDSGYQMLFVRVRNGGSGTPSQPRVAGITVDRTYGVATASDDGSPHQASWAGLVAPDVLQVRVETGRVDRSRDPDDVVVGRPLATGALDDAATFRFTDSPVSTVSVSRISRPVGTMISGEASGPMVHDLFLRLDADLPLGTEHTLELGDDVEPLTFSIDPARSFSPAVHVNQVGFGPDDGGKFALVSAWTGEAGGIVYDSLASFTILDADDGSTVFDGAVVRRPGTASDRNEFEDGDLTGAEVWEADFSTFSKPGRYRVCLPTLGCSHEFTIGDGLWQHVAVDVARSAYHQRNGTTLGQPYTAIERPRPFHPDDGVVFEQTTVGMLDSPEDIGRDDRFDEYTERLTGETVDGAWGGHFDAGDWNSRITHLEYLLVALDLVEIDPELWSRLDLGIPESGDDVPDVVDEGLWDLDLYQRLQHADGGVPGGVDQGRYPEDDETSWDNDARVFVYQPDVWSTYLFAMASARAAHVLEPYDSARADGYLQSATRAMEWAESNLAEVDGAADEVRQAVSSGRSGAAAAMLQTTGDARWNEVFLESSDLDESTAPLDCDGPMCTSAWIYARIDASLVDRTTQQNAIESFRLAADQILQAQKTAAFAWVMDSPNVPFVWGLGPATPHGTALLRAFELTGDDAYRTAMVRAASFSIGGNPLNVSFGTGIGDEPATAVLLTDAEHAGQAIPPGQFQYGPHDLSYASDDDWVEEFFLGPGGVVPGVASVPLLWSWFDVGKFPQMNEFTHHQTTAGALWTFGALASG